MSELQLEVERRERSGVNDLGPEGVLSTVHFRRKVLTFVPAWVEIFLQELAVFSVKNKRMTELALR